MSNGGTEIQLAYYRRFVDGDFQRRITLHTVPNSQSRSFYHIDGVDPRQLNVVWCQQSYDMIESLNLVNQQDLFEKLVLVSDWQKHAYTEKLNCNAENVSVIENGIVPIDDHTKPPGTTNLVYMSTPYRGLDVLLEAFEQIQHLNVHLHVFSSMAIYGQEHCDAEYEHLYKHCRNHSKITYHGSVCHTDMLEALREMHILAYPSTFEETSCICAIEAMSAQCAVVCPKLGALGETCGAFGHLYPYQPNKLAHAQLFAKHLAGAVECYRQCNHALQKQAIDKKHSWPHTIKHKWEKLICSLPPVKRGIIAEYD